MIQVIMITIMFVDILTIRKKKLRTVRDLIIKEKLKHILYNHILMLMQIILLAHIFKDIR